jgi:hypothetical protein
MTGAVQTTYPAFTTIRCENGVWHLQLAEGHAPWFNRVLCVVPIAFFGALGVGVALARTHLVTGWWPGWGVALGEAACGVLLLICFYTGLAGLVAPLLKGEALFDGKTLGIRDRGGAFDFPVQHVLDIRHVFCGATRLEVDTAGHPTHFLSRGPKTALEIQTSDGRIECFHVWDAMKVAWMVQNLRRMVLGRTESSPALEKRFPDAVVSNGIYGRPRRQLALGLILSGIVLSAAAGWFTCLGLSSRHWPRVQGYVTHSNNDTSYHADISYAYTVNGREFTNDDIGIGRNPGDDDVKALLISHPKGSPITVYYDPGKPARSFVIPGAAFFQWFESFLAALPLLGALPLLLHPTTPAQDALALRYRVAVPKGSSARQLATLRWRVPDEVWQVRVRSVKWSSLWMGLRVNTVAALVLWLSHHFLAPVVTPDFPWRVVSLAMLGFSSPLLIAALLEAFRAGGRTPFEYGITDDGILVPPKDRPLIPWSRIATFTVKPDRDLPNYRTLVLHLKDGATRHIPLPTGDSESDVLRQLSSELPQSPPPPNARPLTRTDGILGFALTAATLWGFTFWLNREIHSLHHSDAALWFLFISCLAGPGTWFALTLRRKRAPQQLVALACAPNMMATLGVMFLIVVVHTLRGFQ